ncbi:DUF262 domain-containing protein [Massilia terrae]
MPQRYSVTPHPIDTILTWVKSGEIAIPEIQRPFVWEATKVRNLLDSLYQGYPVGYLIAWRNPTVKLKDGTSSAGKRVLIDGQQRVTALMASILGREVLNKDYETVRIRIAFNPLREEFEVSNPAKTNSNEWIDDVSSVFASGSSLFRLAEAYERANPGCDKEQIYPVLERLRSVTNNHVGIIELDHDLDIETVTEVFIRVNSAGASLSQADFAMSKIAANESYGGNLLRKAIDYFCHMSVAPDFHAKIKHGDPVFASSEFFSKMSWLKDVNDDIYDPSYTDMLRVAFTSRFNRGKLQDLVALLSGRNFETKQFEEAIAEQSFGQLKAGILDFVSQTHFERFTMILRSAGFVASSLMSSQNVVNFAYVVYLKGRAAGVPPAELERTVRRWFVMTVLTARYSGSAETKFDEDVRAMAAQGITAYADAVIASQLSESYWSGLLPRNLETSSASSPYFLAYQAAQVKLGDKGFLSRDITALDLILNRCDVHHLYPRNHLKGQGLSKGKYNQIANFVLTQTEINIAIGDKAPERYFAELLTQCKGGDKKYGGIDNLDEMRANLRANCVPESMLDGEIPAFEDYLEQRRKLMAAKIRAYFEKL